jgi:hypothetical protein
MDYLMGAGGEGMIKSDCYKYWLFLIKLPPLDILLLAYIRPVVLLSYFID